MRMRGLEWEEKTAKPTPERRKPAEGDGRRGEEEAEKKRGEDLGGKHSIAISGDFLSTWEQNIRWLLVYILP